MKGGKALGAALSFCLIFAGCIGGGGGGSPQVVVPPPPPPMPTPGSEEFFAAHFANSGVNNAFAQINASRAYANIISATGANAAADPTDGNLPGTGVGIAFVDDGLDVGHPAFNTASRTVTVDYTAGTATETDLETEVEFSHGTGVAGIAAGVRVRVEFEAGMDSQTLCFPRETCEGGGTTTLTTVITDGVAPGANIKMFARRNGDGGIAIGNAIVAALMDSDIDIINVSLQPADPLIIDSSASSAPNLDLFLPAYRQTGAAEKKLIVWAAGNLHGRACEGEHSTAFGCESGFLNAKNPSLFAGLPFYEDWKELRPFWTMAVAVDENGRITDYSNRCGDAALWCIAAPGGRLPDYGISVPLSRGDGPGMEINRDIATVQGTSFAAPIVAGSLALLKHLFPGMSNIELLERMYATANKEGIYAPDRDPDPVTGVNRTSSIYGQGLLDLGAATEPVGDMMMVSEAILSEEALREASPVSATSLETAGAFGDGIARVFTGAEVAAFDSLGAPFRYPLERFAPRAEVSHIRRQMSGFMEFASASPSERRANRRARSVPVSGGRVASAGLETDGQIPSVYFSRGAADIEDRDLLGKEGHLSYITAPEFAGFEIGGFSAYAFTSPEWAERRGHGAVVSWGPLRSGFVSEPDSALGAVAEGAFGELSGELGFAGLGWEWERGGWRFVADAELGASGADTGGGLISGVSRLLTSSFSTGLIRETEGGHAFKFSVSSPLRIEDGRMGFVIPVGRTPERDILRRSLTADLEPSGRQIDVGAQVVAQTGMGRISIGGMASRHPGHDRSEGPALSFLAGYSAGF